MKPCIILASSSPYRRQLLSQLGIPFECVSPEIDESRHPNESAAHLVERLAREKAHAIMKERPGHWIIGSDQVAEHQGEMLLKPLNAANAEQQLRLCSGQSVAFYTGICLAGPEFTSQARTVTTTVDFRHLSGTAIQTYIKKEQPFDCAGSFKCEGLGITLFRAIHSDDPSALVGLPLIALTQLFLDAGISLLCDY